MSAETRSGVKKKKDKKTIFFSFVKKDWKMATNQLWAVDEEAHCSFWCISHNPL